MGYNSSLYTLSNQTYFTLKKGFNSVAFSNEIGILRFFQNGALYTDEIIVTITEGATSYQQIFKGGIMPFYEISGGAVVLNVSDGEASGTLELTPQLGAFTDLELSFVSYKVRARQAGRYSEFSNIAQIVCLTII